MKSGAMEIGNPNPHDSPQTGVQSAPANQLFFTGDITTMKVTNSIFRLILMLWMLSAAVFAEGPYWETIKQLMSDYNGAMGIEVNELAAKKYTDYLDSLSVEQLINAGRDCSRELNESFLANGFSEGTGFVISFFLHYYSKKTGMKYLDPIIADINDPNQTEMWRSTLIHAFREGVWKNELTIEQFQILIDTIDETLKKEEDSFHVIKESIYTTRSLLQTIEGKIDSPVDSYGQAMAERYGRFSMRLLNVFNDPNSTPELQQISLALTLELYEKPINTKAHIKSLFIRTIHNFRDYPEGTWIHLVKFGKVELELKEVKELVQAMELELEQRYNTESDKEEKRKRWFELERLKRESNRPSVIDN